MHPNRPKATVLRASGLCDSYPVSQPPTVGRYAQSACRRAQRAAAPRAPSAAQYNASSHQNSSPHHAE
ncbi:histone deacetylase complex regulatory component SIN3 [Dokdonella fugitiva]|nr:histone deacetylase complex regulatory component SIN3 [Dokdonella fugitiva]